MMVLFVAAVCFCLLPSFFAASRAAGHRGVTSTSGARRPPLLLLLLFFSLWRRLLPLCLRIWVSVPLPLDNNRGNAVGDEEDGGDDGDDDGSGVRAGAIAVFSSISTTKSKYGPAAAWKVPDAGV